MLGAAVEGRPNTTFDPAGAGALLATATGAGIGAGALIGWAAGKVGYGVIGGTAVGVPAGVLAVYLRYRGTL